jgi:toxin ParE1/3/4
MTKRIVFSPQARAEVTAAARRYADERPELRVEFHSAVTVALERMVKMSRHLGTPPLVEPGLDIKRVFVQRFPFSIYFSELLDRFRVIAVAHEKRVPFYWRERL